MSLEQDLIALKSKGERLNDLRVANKTKLEGLEQEKEKLLAEAVALGIAPDQIEETLKREEAALQAEATALDTELSKVLEQVNGI
jgi:hypothetical protein